jgi:heme/copper-type cytochrome/quinol oxidase subunit 3
MEPVIDRPALNVSGLPTVVFRDRNVVWWGNVLYMTIEGAMFAMAVASYFYYRTRSTDWPPGVNPPALTWGIANGIVLLLSVAPARWIQLQARAGRLAAVRLGLLVLAGFGVASMVLRGFEFAHLNVRWDSNAYGSIVWALIILHSGHLITEWIETLVMIAFTVSPKMEGKRFAEIDMNSDYWFFVVFWAVAMNFVLYGTTRLL